MAGGIPETIGRMAISHGIDSYIAVGRQSGKSASHTISIGNKADTAVHWAATRLADRHGLHSRHATRRFITAAERLDPDIIHLHNIHGYYLHYPTLFEWLRGTGKPVVWTLHDCWSLTGHCAFFNAASCERWLTECHHCPLRGEYPASWLADRSAANHAIKRKVFTSMTDMTLVCVGRWLDSVVARSYLGHLPRRVIGNGIDTALFHPCAPKASAPLILGVASHWEPRKGLDTFLRLRRELPDSWRMRLIGLDDKQRKQMPGGIEAFGRTGSVRELAAHYSEASVFVNASLAEGNCVTKMEALACGTPVVTYDAGGAGEDIPSDAGAVVAPGRFDLLRDAVQAAACGAYSAEACRAAAIAHFDMHTTLENYFNLYTDLLSPRP